MIGNIVSRLPAFFSGDDSLAGHHHQCLEVFPVFARDEVRGQRHGVDDPRLRAAVTRPGRLVTRVLDPREVGLDALAEVVHQLLLELGLVSLDLQHIVTLLLSNLPGNLRLAANGSPAPALPLANILTSFGK